VLFGELGDETRRTRSTDSLLVDAEFLVLAAQLSYHHNQSGKQVAVQSCRDARNLLDLPLEGILLIGY